MPDDLKKKKAKAYIERLASRDENYQSIFDKKDDGIKWTQAKSEANFGAKSMNKAPVGLRVDEDAAMAAASNLRSKRRFSNPSIKEDSVFIGEKHAPKVPKSELQPLAIGKEPKLKADEAIRSEASKTLRERRSSAARRLAVRGGGEDRRQALVKGLEARKVAKGVQPAIKVQTPKTPGIKLRSLGGVIGAIASAPSIVDSFIEIQKSAKSKRPMKTTEGMRLILGMPSADEEKYKGKRIY